MQSCHTPCRPSVYLRRLPHLAVLVVSLMIGTLLSGIPCRADTIYQTNHVYLYQSSGSPIDVTSSMYTVGGNTYVVVGGNTIQIVPDYQGGHVFDVRSNTIGFICLTNHIFISHGTAAPDDVTSTLYTSGGNSYVVDNGTTLQVVLDYQGGHVFDVHSNTIGFICLQSAPGS